MVESQFVDYKKFTEVLDVWIKFLYIETALETCLLPCV